MLEGTMFVGTRPAGVSRVIAAVCAGTMIAAALSVRVIAQAQARHPAVDDAKSLAAKKAEDLRRLSALDPDDRRRLDTWLAAIAEHAPGERDSAEASVAQWSSDNLYAVFSILRKVGVPPELASAVESRLGVTGTPGSPLAPAGFDVMLRRGALLHADIAMLNHDGAGYHLPADDTTGTLVDDAEHVGVAPGTVHWAFARSLLDADEPRPADDPYVRQWYRATAAWLLASHDYASLEPHLDHVRSLFPKDPVLLLEAGALHEVYASPGMQGLLVPPPRASAIAPHGGVVLVSPRQESLPFGSADDEEGKALDFLHRALAVSPSLVEAKVRLGNVLALRGRHKEAITELRDATSSSAPPQVAFYAQLLLGRELHTLGRDVEARQAASRALSLFPGAESARLLQSEVERDSGDLAGAARELDVLGQPPGDAARDDPWWLYDMIHSPDADQLVAALRTTRP